MIDILTESLRTAVLVTGLVVIMMMLIEVFNVRSHGRMFGGLRNRRVGQVLLSAALGAVPGCMGGFASVSLYTHGLISFGALIAMMIASSGDEAFVMLAMFPGKSAWIFLILFVLAVAVGLLVDLFRSKDDGCHSMNVHDEDRESKHEHHHERHYGWQRIVMFLGVLVFIGALLAAAIGIIPESGPHLVFVSLYAAGVVPLPVLLASCISQDGHASLPLLAQSRGSFLKAKLINVIVAVLIGLISLLL